MLQRNKSAGVASNNLPLTVRRSPRPSIAKRGALRGDLYEQTIWWFEGRKVMEPIRNRARGIHSSKRNMHGTKQASGRAEEGNAGDPATAGRNGRVSRAEIERKAVAAAAAAGIAAELEARRRDRWLAAHYPGYQRVYDD